MLDGVQQIGIARFKRQLYANSEHKGNTDMKPNPEITWARWKVSAADGAECFHRDLPIVDIATLDKSKSSEEVYDFLQVGGV